MVNGVTGMNAAILGVSGYSGSVLYKLLKEHPKVDKVNLYSRKPRRSLAEAVTAFKNQPEYLQEYDPQAIMAENDVLFLATPAGVSSQLASVFMEAKFPVIDLSGDLRLKKATSYEKWYQKPAAATKLLAQATYGLAEFEPVGTYIANPGCYATATLLALAPLVKEDLLQLDSIIVDAKSGLAGAGKKLTETSHYAYINENAQAYKVNCHQHIPEIVQELQTWNDKLEAIQFTTTLIPITRGIMVSAYAKVKPGFAQADLEAVFTKYYHDRKWVRFSGSDLPAIKDVIQSNYCDIGLSYNPVTNTVLVVSVIDNLLKGASGQAVQNFNKLFGFEETLGLPAIPAWP